MGDGDLEARVDRLEARLDALDGGHEHLELIIDAEALGEIKANPLLARSFTDGSCLGGVSKPLKAGTGMPAPPVRPVVIRPRER